MYPETAIMSAAREAGAAVANGLGMLLHQGRVLSRYGRKRHRMWMRCVVRWKRRFTVAGNDRFYALSALGFFIWCLLG